MKIVMLSSFPPTRCGIASYADQHARKLESQGHEVKRWNINLLNGHGWRTALVAEFEHDIRRSEKVIIQYQSSLFHSKTGLPLFKSLLPYWRLSEALKYGPVDVEIVAHEDFEPVTPIFSGMQRRAAKGLFAMADSVTFHTNVEAESFSLPVVKKKVVPPDSHYVKFTSVTKREARDYLNLSQSSEIFLTAGFYHPGKGFERVINAFRRNSSGNKELYVLTSDRMGNFAKEIYELRRLGKAKNIHVINDFVSDQEFDIWIQASDVVVIPYLRGFTSSLLARAKLYNKPCIVSSLPALMEQASPRDFLFKSDDDLVRAIVTVAE